MYDEIRIRLEPQRMELKREWDRVLYCPHLTLDVLGRPQRLIALYPACAHGPKKHGSRPWDISYAPLCEMVLFWSELDVLENGLRVTHTFETWKRRAPRRSRPVSRPLPLRATLGFDLDPCCKPPITS